MQELLSAFSRDADFQSIVSGLRSGMKEQLISGLSGSSKGVMISALAAEMKAPLLVLTHNMFSAQKIVEDLVECLPEEQILLFPAQEILSAEAAAASPEMLAQRIEALTRLASGYRGVVVAPFAAVRKLLPNKEMFVHALCL